MQNLNNYTNIHIFGASGFLGKNLYDFFKCKDYCIHRVSLREANWEICLNGREQVFINLIGKAHDHKGNSSVDDYFEANVGCTKTIFHAFLESKATSFIHVSSLAALEEFESLQPLVETDECHPISWYGKSKRQAEEWLMEQKLPENKKLIIIRPPMVHGPGDKGNLGLLYKLISKGVPYPLASFDNRRSFIGIDNFQYFIEQIIERNNVLETGIYHVADDEAVSTKEIIAIIKKVTGKKVLDLSLPTFVIKGIAKMGDIIPIPLNTKRLKKMTADLLVSNLKIKRTLKIEKLPVTASEGLEKTIRSFNQSK